MDASRTVRGSPTIVGRYVLLRQLASERAPTFAATTVTDTRDLFVVERLADATTTTRRLAEEVLRIHHPNLARVHALVSGGAKLDIVSDYVDGQRLSDLLVEPGGIPLGVMLRILIDVLNGLSALHDHKNAAGASVQLVHGWVRPEVVLPGLDGITRLLQIVSGAPPALPGSLAYVAPEVLRGEACGVAADLYAVGVMLWEALARERLFGGDSAAAILARHDAGSMPRARLRDADSWGAGLVDVAARALRSKPTERFASVAEMARDIRKVAMARLEPSSSVAKLVTTFAGARIVERRSQLIDQARQSSSAVVPVARAVTHAQQPAGTAGPPPPAGLTRGKPTLQSVGRVPGPLGDTPKPPGPLGDTPKPPGPLGDTPKPPGPLGDTPKPPGPVPKPPIPASRAPAAARLPTMTKGPPQSVPTIRVTPVDATPDVAPAREAAAPPCATAAAAFSIGEEAPTRPAVRAAFPGVRVATASGSVLVPSMHPVTDVVTPSDPTVPLRAAALMSGEDLPTVPVGEMGNAPVSPSPDDPDPTHEIAPSTTLVTAPPHVASDHPHSMALAIEPERLPAEASNPVRRRARAAAVGVLAACAALILVGVVRGLVRSTDAAAASTIATSTHEPTTSTPAATVPPAASAAAPATTATAMPAAEAPPSVAPELPPRAAAATAPPLPPRAAPSSPTKPARRSSYDPLGI